jgi:hypothetical protein
MRDGLTPSEQSNYVVQARREEAQCFQRGPAGSQAILLRRRKTRRTESEGTLVTNSGGGFDRDFKIAYSEQASLQIDQQLGHGFVLSAGYLFLRAHHQIRPQNLNVCPTQGETNAATSCPAANPPALPDGKALFSGPLYSNAGLMYFLDSTGTAKYDGATIAITNHFNKYLRFRRQLHLLQHA